MTAIINGVAVDYGHGHVYPGDIWKCFKCNYEICNTIGNPSPDPEYNRHCYYIYGTLDRPANINWAPTNKIWKGKKY